MSQSEAARTYGVSQGWISRLLARYRAEGEGAFESRSRRPRTNPNATPPETVTAVLTLREQLTAAGHDAGADTLAWHLQRHHEIVMSRATVHRILVRAGLVTPAPAKRPKSSYIRFEAAQPNECWQSDFTHYRLTDGTDTEIVTWLDDHARYALHVTAHARVTATIVATTFLTTAQKHGFPAATLTDNGMVYTVRLAGHGRRGGRTKLEALLRTHGITQRNGSPGHPQTQGKVERFQQTLKKWLRAQAHQPRTLHELQHLLDEFRDDYNRNRPHRSLPHHATPHTAYTTRPKATPSRQQRETDHHDRVRTDRIDSTGAVTLRVNGRLHHIGIGRTHKGTHVRLLIHDLNVTVISLTTGEILRDLTIDPHRDYQPRFKKQ